LPLGKWERELNEQEVNSPNKRRRHKETVPSDTNCSLLDEVLTADVCWSFVQHLPHPCIGTLGCVSRSLSLTVRLGIKRGMLQLAPTGYTFVLTGPRRVRSLVCRMCRAQCTPEMVPQHTQYHGHEWGFGLDNSNTERDVELIRHVTGYLPQHPCGKDTVGDQQIDAQTDNPFYSSSDDYHDDPFYSNGDEMSDSEPGSENSW